MANELQPKQKSLEEAIREAAEKDPKAALEIALAGNQRLAGEIERLRIEERSLADVTVEADGFHAANLAAIYRLGKLYAGSEMVPVDYRGKPNDCAIVCQMAVRWRLDPFQVFSQVYFVHGKPGLEAKLMVTLLNKSGVLKGRLRYKFDGEGDGYGCRALGTDALSGEEVVGPKVDWSMVKKEGWLSKNGSKWQSMPEVMFHYRAAALFCRLHYPDIMMGLSTTDELQDIGESRITNKPITLLALDDLDATCPEPQMSEPEQSQEPANNLDGGKITPEKRQRPHGKVCSAVLAYVQDRPGCTVDQINAAMDDSQEALTLALDELCRAEMIEYDGVGYSLPGDDQGETEPVQDDAETAEEQPQKAQTETKPKKTETVDTAGDELEAAIAAIKQADTVKSARAARKAAYAIKGIGDPELERINTAFRSANARLSPAGGAL